MSHVVILARNEILSSTKIPDDVHYDVSLNTLTVPATMMGYPHYIAQTPLWVALAGLGWRIANKLFHLFESRHHTPIEISEVYKTDWSKWGMGKMNVSELLLFCHSP